MGFIKLFSVASFPVIKVLLITALGLFLALDNISILGEDARKKVNQLVFYVFNPSLVGSNLAKTITFESVVKLWFMPVNILGTFILGSALGWILIKMTRPPKRMEGLILGCCSAGNLGNLPMIIIAAICKQEGSPFGEPDLCNQYGMAYAALSMAIGAVFLWSYVYNLMRISSSRIQNEDRTSNDSSMLKASADISVSHPHNFSKTLNTTKGTVDNAYTILLPETNSEEKVSFPSKIRHYVRMISSHLNFKSMFAPSTLGAIAGFIIGVVPQIRNFMIGNNAPLHVVEDSASMLGEAAIPTVTLIMGANLLKGLKGTTAPVWTIVGIVVVRYIFLPLLGIAVVKGAMHLSLVHSDALYQFVLLLQYALPPAMNIGTIAQLFGSGESECSVIMLWTYALASIAVTLWSPPPPTPMATLLLPNPFSTKLPAQRYSHRRFTCSSITAQSRSAKEQLLALIADQDRGIKTQSDPAKHAAIVEAINAMAAAGEGSVTTGDALSATWRLLWTTEKEQLFIVEKAPLFGTQAGDVLQVIDVRNRTLNNVITFPPDGVFIVRSTIEVASPQRVNFRFTSAVLCGKNWEIPLPPFGQGWFDIVYLDDDLRVVKDIRGDYLVVDRASYDWKE